jgi:dTDP-4-dehydrorhamnose reductase
MILLTGANGQLGQDFQKLFNQLGEEYIATDYIADNGCQALDITDHQAVEEFVADKEFDMIINCAAYNNVDKAEEEEKKAFALNCDAPKKLAEIAKKKGAVFVTYSTDFVFDGFKKTPYTEEDKTNPLSIYGKSKAQGEQMVLDAYNNSFVIRTSWVFGIGNNNFNKSVINWSRSKDELKIVDDQVSVPTYSWDLALYSWDLIQTDNYGLYHLSNNGEASKYDQAKYVLESIGWKGKLGRAKTADFNLPAKRAEYSKLDSSKAEELIGKKMPGWKDAIDRFLKELVDNGELKIN